MSDPAPGAFDPQPPADELDWGPVIGCLPMLENDFDAGGWAASREDQDGVIHLGYPELSADADQVLGAPRVGRAPRGGQRGGHK